MIITRTPFRISFFGGGTDLPDFYQKYGGEVLSTTIDKYLYITLRHMPRFWDYKHRLVYGSNTELVSEINEIQHPSIREVMRYLQIPYGVDLHYNTDIPARSGIGSSSSFTVGLLNALNGLNGKMTSKQKLAEDAIYVEQKLIGEAVGSQDQTAAAYGGLNHIVFRQDSGIEVHPLTIPEYRTRELNRHLFLVFTGFQRFAKDIEKGKIQRLSSNQGQLLEMRSYVRQAIDLLSCEDDISGFGELLNDTWQRKKSLSDQVSNEHIDRMYRVGRENGAIGGKLLGAGGGGFMLFFVRPRDRSRLKAAFREYTQVPFAFDRTGSQVIYYRPKGDIQNEE